MADDATTMNDSVADLEKCLLLLSRMLIVAVVDVEWPQFA